MKFRIKDWAVFLACEGLFLIGLAVGIWGSKNFAPTPIAAMVFFIGGGLSLLIAGLVWFGSRRGGTSARVSLNAPISLDDSFRANLRFQGQAPLIKLPHMESYFIVVNEGVQRIKVSAHVSCILEHWSGPEVSVLTASGNRQLSEREILRIDGTEAHEIILRRANEDLKNDPEFRSRFLVHLISTGDELV